MDFVQLNLHETDLSFRYLSHHLTWHCSSISEDLHKFAAFAHKIVFVIVSVVKLFKNNSMDLSHIQLAVPKELQKLGGEQGVTSLPPSSVGNGIIIMFEFH